MTAGLAAAAIEVLAAAEPAEKIRLTNLHAEAWRAGRLAPPAPGDPRPPERPGRPARPELRPPREMPARRKAGSLAGRVALLHALAHIELNAIDLSWDIVARFGAASEGGVPVPRAFCEDWVSVAHDEARHFGMLARRLEELGSAYGALPAHDGLWQASQETAHDMAARLAIVPLVLEARGLDVTPATVENLRRFGDDPSADILQIIHDDEIGHVAAGRRWFGWVCARRGCDTVTTWQELVRRHFRGMLKPPFNIESRSRAEFGPEFYVPLVEQDPPRGE
ncbi:ferritin-like domain-containing protein [Arenibaculum pallidiluteum]|uniref:ferritin-like domain-containing protein n=1 Tax=Arenibaculum pallidiluteum TaxID=2812559 RepID=UPI001A96370B|nr:ferritin-like domain-containing protein [Arenibaculum pallidiluteum]